MVVDGRVGQVTVGAQVVPDGGTGVLVLGGRGFRVPEGFAGPKT